MSPVLPGELRRRLPQDLVLDLEASFFERSNAISLRSAVLGASLWLHRRGPDVASLRRHDWVTPRPLATSRPSCLASAMARCRSSGECGARIGLGPNDKRSLSIGAKNRGKVTS